MRSALPLLALALLSACSDATAPVAASPVVRVGDSSLRLELSASNAVGSAGIRTTFRATLTNDGPADLVLPTAGWCLVFPYFRTAAGEVVFPQGGGWGCDDAPGQFTIPAGQSVVHDFMWERGRLLWPSSRAFGTLPPGRYLVTVETGIGGVPLRTAPLPVTLR